MILVEEVSRSFGSTRALDAVDLLAPAGTVLGLLGPNGAGKTTLVRILTTLLRPDSGRARVAGLDVVRDAARLRYFIGLAGQYAAVDELLTGRENLELVGRWYHLPRREYRRRAAEILERYDLAGAADRPVRGYSGGMRRRLDIAASLIGSPPVLFLDEPTTGLDPRTRNEVWETIRELVGKGTTVLLTTQYMEEAEHLAHGIVVMDLGRVIATGTAAQLKARIGGATLEVQVRERDDLEAAAKVLEQVTGAAAQRDSARLLAWVATGDGTAAVVAAGGALAAARIEVEDLGVRRPSLDEVFLALTGSPASEAAAR